MPGKEVGGVRSRPSGFPNSPNFSPTVQQWGRGLPLQTLGGRSLRQWGQRRKALAQIENRMCPISGGGEEGPMVHGRYLGAALPRAPFLAKRVLMGKRWC